MGVETRDSLLMSSGRLLLLLLDDRKVHTDTGSKRRRGHEEKGFSSPLYL